MITDLKAGVYRHWKGPLYLVLGLAHDANADTISVYDNILNEYVIMTGREVVVYVGLQTNSAHMGARLAVRTVDDFFANVCQRKEHTHYGKVVPQDEETVCQGVPRFAYLGPRLELGME